MSWSTSEVARIAGVSSRTLRHYDRVGLLPPASTSGNGIRWYGESELRRLQQVLLYRELGLPLGTIRQLLDGQCDEAEALRRHHERLLEEARRLRRLARTVARTIDTLKGDDAMSAEDMFDGFDPRQRRWEEELVGRYGDGVRQHIESSREAVKGWTQADLRDAAQEWDEFDARAVDLVQQGIAPTSGEAQQLIGEHFAIISRYWTPDSTSYAGLGQLYVEHADFRARYDGKDPRLAEWLRDAMASYATAVLA